MKQILFALYDEIFTGHWSNLT